MTDPKRDDNCGKLGLVFRKRLVGWLAAQIHPTAYYKMYFKVYRPQQESHALQQLPPYLLASSPYPGAAVCPAACVCLFGLSGSSMGLPRVAENASLSAYGCIHFAPCGNPITIYSWFVRTRARGLCGYGQDHQPPPRTQRKCRTKLPTARVTFGSFAVIRAGQTIVGHQLPLPCRTSMSWPLSAYNLGVGHQAGHMFSSGPV